MEPSKNQAASGKTRVRGRGRRSVKAKNLFNQNLKRGRVNGRTTSLKVARVEGKGSPSLKSMISNSEEEKASFEVDEGTGVGSPKSSSPVTEPQQPLNDEEDLSYTNSHLSFEQIAENMKKLHELILAESKSEDSYRCNCCVKSYYESLTRRYDELDFSVD